jgi:O-antigen ligase
MFEDRPIWGFGFGQFARAKLPYLTDQSTDLQLEQIRTYVHHNTFLAILTETGLIGLGFFLAVLGGWAKAGWQLVRAKQAPLWVQQHGMLLLAVLGIGVWQMVGHEITFTPLDQSLLYCLAGIGVGLRQSLRQHELSAPVPYSDPAWIQRHYATAPRR